MAAWIAWPVSAIEGGHPWPDRTCFKSHEKGSRARCPTIR